MSVKDKELDLETELDSQNEDSTAELDIEGLTLADGKEEASFLPEPTELDEKNALGDSTALTIDEAAEAALADSELAQFESATIEESEFIQDETLHSILESVLFASDRPVSLASLKLIFKGTNIKGDRIRRALDQMAVELAGAERGMTLEEVPGGYQLRTKLDNLKFISRHLKSRPFRLSGPALEVLAIVAYKQPLIKSEIDEIRGVESGHLLRALMERNLVNFEGKSDLPGKPMLYGTTKKFLEIFGLRNLKELPTLSQIDELLPEGITEDDVEKTKLSDLTGALSEANGASSYSQGEEELNKISDELQKITSTTDFFEEEKRKQREKRDAEKAQSLREALLVGESISTRDRNWLVRYDEALSSGKSFNEEEPKVAVAVNTSAQTIDEASVASSAEDEEVSFEESESPLFADDDEDSESVEAAGPIADIDGEEDFDKEPGEAQV